MRKVFISSVIEEYNEPRTAARKAVTLMGDKPVMAENFGARPYSSRDACITEVSQSDIYVLLMGQRFGHPTAEGISVTQAEFREAKATGKPILVFIEQCEMEPEQLEFRREAEEYASGFHRESFSFAEELKDKIIIALRQLDQAQAAASEEAFSQRVDNALHSMDWQHRQQSPVLSCVWWPQPTRELDVVALEPQLDGYFDQLCRIGLAAKRDGYDDIKGRDYTGLKCGANSLTIFSDGLLCFTADPTAKKQGDGFSSFFVPPSRVRELALSAFNLFEGGGAWCHLGLHNMQHRNFAEPPQDTHRGVSIATTYKDGAAQHKKLIPLTPAAYRQWLETAIGLFHRELSASN